MMPTSQVRTDDFQPHVLWAWMAALFALLSALAAATSARRGSDPREGTHAAGVTAALALACGVGLQTMLFLMEQLLRCATTEDGK